MLQPCRRLKLSLIHIFICYRNLKKRTDDALTLFSQSHDTSGIVVPDYPYFVEKYNEMVTRLKEIAQTPADIDTMQNEDDQKPVSYTHLDVYKRQSIDIFYCF